jgi:hypothetical protein
LLIEPPVIAVLIIVPPVMATAFAYCVDIVPRPRTGPVAGWPFTVSWSVPVPPLLVNASSPPPVCVTPKQS